MNTRIFIYFLLAFVTYNAYLVIVKPQVNSYQNQWQKNLSQAQDFMSLREAKKVIVGSSMSERMGDFGFSSDYYNLSFSGGSSLTGLEIIKRNGINPSVIYIENNIIFKAKDNKMVNTLFTPIWWKIKKVIPAFQEKYQPLNILLSFAKNNIGKTHEQRLLEKRNEHIFSKQLKLRVAQGALDLKNYNNELKELKELVIYFESKGIIIYFFEVPIDKSLTQLKNNIQTQVIIKENFGFRWLNLPNNNDHETTDGIHLTYKSAYNFSRLFVEQTQKAEHSK